MQNKKNAENCNKLQSPLTFAKSIAIKLPGKYSDNPDSLANLSHFEKNALFSYLINEFFHQIEKNRILTNDFTSELSFLCESYFDFLEFREESLLTEDYENIYSNY